MNRSHHTVTESGASTGRAAGGRGSQHYYNGRNQPQVDVANIDSGTGSGGRGSDHAHGRIDASSQTDVQEYDGDEEMKAGPRRYNPVYDVEGSLSPDGRRQYAAQADQYALETKGGRPGGGRGLFATQEALKPRHDSAALISVTPLRAGD